MTGSRPARVVVGVSGWSYPHWRGRFYPAGLRHADELGYLAERMPGVELNASFYSLRRPANYLAWAAATPDGFVFAIKGGRFITHLKRLVDVQTPLANFFASGVLALGPRLGPILWQLPPNLAYDAATLGGFLDQLPQDTAAAARLAHRHDSRLEGRSWTEVDVNRRLRHALEPRHESFWSEAAVRQAADHDVAMVVSDGAGRWPLVDRVTTDLVYVRLHGSTRLYASGYSRDELAAWADRVRGWRADVAEVHVYFDNDGDAHAPQDALTLQSLLAERPAP